MLHDRLQYRLQNSEPKCANCNWWDQFVENPHLGICCNVTGQSQKSITGDEYSGFLAPTTDLTVCSKWEMKLDAEQTEEASAEAEQA